MRIAMLGHKRMPSREGGVEVVVTELATRMAALGHEVTVYSRAGAGQLPGEREYEGVRVMTVKTLDVRGLAAATSSYYATKAAIADKPDVIHFHAEGPCAMVPMAEKAGIRTVATIHGLDWRRAKWGRVGSLYIKHGEKAAAKRADEIIVLSRGIQGYFEGAYGRRTHLIPNGIEPKEKVAPHEITQRYRLTEGSYVLYLGRVVPEKGAHYLMNAFKQVETDKRLVIAGGPSDSESYYRHVRKLALGDGRIVFPGFVEGDVLAELYSNAYCYVLPSDLEGMPMSLLEAMSYGRCCLTSDVAECVDVLDGAGVSFVRGDVTDLASRLQALIDEPEHVRGLGEAAKEVSARYSWDEVTGKTLSVYSQG